MGHPYRCPEESASILRNATKRLQPRNAVPEGRHGIDVEASGEEGPSSSCTRKRRPSALDSRMLLLAPRPSAV